MRTNQASADGWIVLIPDGPSDEVDRLNKSFMHAKGLKLIN